MAGWPGGYTQRWRLLVPTASLPFPNVHGVTVDDSGTVWVLCWDETDGALVRVDGTTPTTVTTGLDRPQPSMATDASGRVYYLTGSYTLAATPTSKLWRYDPSAGTTTELIDLADMSGFCLSRSLGTLFVLANTGRRIERYTTGGAFVSTLAAWDGGFARNRVVALNAAGTEIFTLHGNAVDLARVFDVATGTQLWSASAAGIEATGGVAVPAHNGVLLTDQPDASPSVVPGTVRWFDFDTRTFTAFTINGKPTGTGSGYWTGIAVQSGRILLCHGGMWRQSADADAIGGTDYGLVRIDRSGWTAGMAGSFG